MGFFRISKDPLMPSKMIYSLLHDPELPSCLSMFLCLSMQHWKNAFYSIRSEKKVVVDWLPSIRSGAVKY